MKSHLIIRALVNWSEKFSDLDHWTEPIWLTLSEPSELMGTGSHFKWFFGSWDNAFQMNYFDFEIEWNFSIWICHQNQLWQSDIFSLFIHCIMEKLWIIKHVLVSSTYLFSFYRGVVKKVIDEVNWSGSLIWSSSLAIWSDLIGIPKTELI